MTSLLREEEPKKKEPIVTLKMDPDSTDIKDMKIGINMDAETAYKLYQDNKQYLPSKEQMLAGATKTADFVQKNNDVITGNKVDPKKKGNDPLSASIFSGLFGGGKKEPTQQPSSNANSKKGIL
jgi:hypothetical protein